MLQRCGKTSTLHELLACPNTQPESKNVEMRQFIHRPKLTRLQEDVKLHTFWSRICVMHAVKLHNFGSLFQKKAQKTIRTVKAKKRQQQET